METTKIALFKGSKIRKTLHNDEWWFVVEDVVLALIDSVNVKDYINKMRLRDPELSKGYGQIVHTLFFSGKIAVDIAPGENCIEEVASRSEFFGLC
ncbi:MAG: hypothetical protein Q7S66_01215 [bacterium]|nr:hypothetical protein [bacterium]